MFLYFFVCVCERQKSPTPKIRVVRHVTFDTLGTQNIRTAVVRIYFTFFFFLSFGWWFCRQIVLFAAALCFCVVRLKCSSSYTHSRTRRRTKQWVRWVIRDNNKSIECECVHFTVGLIKIYKFCAGKPIIWWILWAESRSSDELMTATVVRQNILDTATVTPFQRGISLILVVIYLNALPFVGHRNCDNDEACKMQTIIR